MAVKAQNSAMTNSTPATACSAGASAVNANQARMAAAPTARVQRPSEPPPTTTKIPHWSALRVWSDGRQREVLVLDAQRRITELFRWKRGRPTPGMWFVDIATGSAIVDPGAVVWDDFPEPRASGAG